MKPFDNPFADDPDRRAIWEMLVRRDIQAFVASDWAMVADDFDEQRFFGIHAHNSVEPNDWSVGFPTLAAYRTEWLKQAAQAAATRYAEPLVEAIFRATTLREIDVTGDVALARKKFDGMIRKADGGADLLNWQTLYFCRRAAGRWKITGFVGYLKYR